MNDLRIHIGQCGASHFNIFATKKVQSCVQAHADNVEKKYNLDGTFGR